MLDTVQIRWFCGPDLARRLPVDNHFYRCLFGPEVVSCYSRRQLCWIFSFSIRIEVEYTVLKAGMKPNTYRVKTTTHLTISFKLHLKKKV